MLLDRLTHLRVSNNVPKRYYRIILILLLFSCISLDVAFCEITTVPDHSEQQLSFIRSLYEEQDFYRSISEALRIKFEYPQSSARAQMDLFLLKSYYRLGEWDSLSSTAGKILSGKRSDSDPLYRKRIGLILTAASLQRGSENTANTYWKQFVREAESEEFPSSIQTEGLLNPDKAAFYSGIIPGSGLLLSGHYGRAAVSFLLNLLFVSGTYAAVTQEEYGIASLLFFFEIGWYFGGKRASAEAAENYNRALIRSRQQRWIKSQLEMNNLADLMDN